MSESMDQHEKNTYQSQSSERVGESIPALISKKWLCCHFNLISGGRPMYHTLYSKVLTPEIIKAAGLKMSEVRRRGVSLFNAVQSAALRKVLFPAFFFLVCFFSASAQITTDKVPRDTSFRTDTIYGIGLIRDTVPVVVQQSEGTYKAALVQIPVIVDMYSIIKWVEVVDPRTGKSKAIFKWVGYFKSDSCEEVPYSRILLFKQTQ